MKTMLFFLCVGVYQITASMAGSPSFDSCMALNPKYFEHDSSKNSDWNLAISLYNDFITQSILSAKPLIPKIIHQIWLGSPFPEKYRKWQESWLKKNPSWQYKLWTEKEINALGLVNRKLYNAAKNYGKKSDIARYEILYRFGGLYVDTDFECLKPFEILHHSCDFYAGLAYAKSAVLYNGLIAARPGHPILKHCIAHLKKSSENNSQEILQSTGPHHLTRAFRAEVKKSGGRPVAFPVSYFYPWPEYERLNTAVSRYSWIRPESFAVHHWEVSWRPTSELKQFIIWQDLD